MAGKDMFFSPAGRGGIHFFDNDGQKPDDAVMVPPDRVDEIVEAAAQGPFRVAELLGIATLQPAAPSSAPKAAAALPARIVRYSPTTKGFYPSNRHYRNLPGDLIEMEEDDYRALIDGQRAGDEIVHRNGKLPVLKPRTSGTCSV